MKLNGKPGTQPAAVWASTTALVDFKLSEKGDELTLTATPETPVGLHWLRFHNQDGASSLLPVFVGSLTEISETEPNNTLDEAGQIESLPAVVNGILHKGGEVDTYAVSLLQGQTLVAAIDANATLGSPMDPIVQILDPNGFVLEQNDDDNGFDPLVTFTAQQADVYYVRTFCFPSAPNSTINFAGGADYIYRLTLTVGPYGATDANLGKMNSGWNLTPPPESGEFPRRYSIADTSQFTHTTPKPESSKVETLPFAATGMLAEAGETDSYSLTAKKDDPFRFQVLARDIASQLDPVLIIRSKDGKIQKESDDLSRDERDVDLIWKAPADGEYFLEVSDRYQHGGMRYFYLLQVVAEEPRVELSVAADQFTTKRDKPLEVPVTVNRLSGFAQEVSIAVKNLPPGAIAEPVVSESKGDSAKKVTLKIDVKDADPFQGPIEIVGSYGDSPNSVTTTAALKVTKRKTTQIWLTIPTKPDAPVEETQEQK